MQYNIDMELLELLEPKDVKVLIDTVEPGMMLPFFKKNCQQYAKYMSRLGRLDAKSKLVQTNVPIIMYELYKRKDMNILAYVSTIAKELKEQLPEELKEMKLTPEDFESKSAEEIVEKLIAYEQAGLDEDEKESMDGIEVDLLQCELKLNGIKLEEEKFEKIKTLWCQYVREVKEEEKEKKESSALNQLDEYKMQLKSQKKDYEKKLTEAQKERTNIDNENSKKEKEIERLNKEIEELNRNYQEKEEDLKSLKNELESYKSSPLENEPEAHNKSDEIYVSDKIIIDSVKETLERLRDFSGVKDMTMEAVVEFIRTQERTHFYFDEKMNLRDEADKGIKYLWLDTGLVRDNGNPIFLSLLHQDEYYVGHFAGDWRFLSGTMITYYPFNIRIIKENAEKFKNKYEKRIDKRIQKHLNQPHIKEEVIDESAVTVEDVRAERGTVPEAYGVFDSGKFYEEKNVYEDFRGYSASGVMEITNNVKELLMINNWKSVEGLNRYLKVIGSRLQQLMELGKINYYIQNNIKSAVVNTGLLNQFGVDIHILYRYHKNNNTYVAYQIMESKMDYLEQGFTKEQLAREILPINFFDEGEEVFGANIEDFDINHRSLLHIIDERRERFPENVQNLSANAIAIKINNALEQGLKMQKRDRHYAKPIYSSKCRGISWMLPLHVNRELTEEPELVLVIRKVWEFYEIKTIMPYDDEVKDRITAMSLYNGLW